MNIKIFCVFYRNLKEYHKPNENITEIDDLATAEIININENANFNIPDNQHEINVETCDRYPVQEHFYGIRNVESNDAQSEENKYSQQEIIAGQENAMEHAVIDDLC